MRRPSRFTLSLTIALILLIVVVALGVGFYLAACTCFGTRLAPLTSVSTLAGANGELGEPFGIAVRNGDTYVSDGSANKIWRVSKSGEVVEFASGLNTPSAIAFDGAGDLLVADSGSHTIRKVDKNGRVSILAGAEGEFGDADGPAPSARFNGPIGLAVLDDGAVAVADTYNDKIKIIRNGNVATIAGTARGFADGPAANAKFDTPCGITAWVDNSIVVADTMNSRLRIIRPNGTVETLAGTGKEGSGDGLLFQAAFYRPSAIAAGPDGSLFIADRHAVRTIQNRPIPIVETVTKQQRGFVDGALGMSQFNRISGIAVTDENGLAVADSDNGAVRMITSQTAKKSEPEHLVRTKRTDPTEFRGRQPGRWPYDPPNAKRDIAGTLGEIRGEIIDQTSQAWFHNGLDIAGGYGEKARFIRDEKVLDPVSVENFATLRELIRLPTVGYIHVRLGRDASEKAFEDTRFQFDSDMKGVRVRRGTEFRAGEVIGTLNAMNHVHLIAGPAGDEMNAFDALVLPGLVDTTPPTIENVSIFDENWLAVETKPGAKRIKVFGNIRIVVQAYDRVDGNPERRRLGVYRLGYQVVDRDRPAVSEQEWSISFDRNPPHDAVRFAYAPGSKSGATGETIFRYVVTNYVNGHESRESFLDTSRLAEGVHILRVAAADYFGNSTSKEIEIEVTR